MCDPAVRSVNTGAACGAEDDWYFYSPWRAPGAAPVFDSCGMAGGHKPPQGGFGGIYVNTSHAKLGDKGTEVLPKAPSGVSAAAPFASSSEAFFKGRRWQTTWAAGRSYEVTWTIEANQCAPPPPPHAT